jgi:hypothetical protein
MQKGDGSESHFVECASDAACTEIDLGKCVGGKCERRAATLDGATTPLDAMAALCSPADPFYCVNECGYDFYRQPLCVNGTWTCPQDAPHRVDECPFICGGGGPLPPCCGNDGQAPRICPDGARAICPPGTFEYPDGNCPNDCAVADPKLPVPYPMTFRFTNASGKKVAVWHGCTYEFELTACATRYTIPVTPFVICGPICPDMRQPTCGPCNNDPAPVSAATPLEQSWDGFIVTNEEPAADRVCAQRAALGPTRYRIKVPVYSDAPPMLPGGGYEKTPLYAVSVDFTTSPGGVVEIPIDQGP